MSRPDRASDLRRTRVLVTGATGFTGSRNLTALPDESSRRTIERLSGRQQTGAT